MPPLLPLQGESRTRLEAAREIVQRSLAANLNPPVRDRLAEMLTEIEALLRKETARGAAA